jgi:hypothetical protein
MVSEKNSKNSDFQMVSEKVSKQFRISEGI